MLLMVEVSQALGQAPPEPNQLPNRVLVESVQLVRPSTTGLAVTEPVDVLIVDGYISSIGPDLDIDLQPGEVRLRGQDRWLMPSPTIRLIGRELIPSDLIVAGLSGIGGIVVDDEQSARSDALEARAKLDDGIMASFLPRDSVCDGTLTLRDKSLPTMERLIESSGSAEKLLGAIARRDQDPFSSGKPARFLLVLKDPTTHPETILDPHAVLLDTTYALRSERLVRLEEAVAGVSIPELPTSDKDGVEHSLAWSRAYRLVINGLERGRTFLEVYEYPDGSVEAQVRERSAAPLDESIVASVQWPSAHATLRQTTRGVVLEAAARRTGSQYAMEVALNGTPADESPIVLAESDRFMPHPLLILLDALRAQDGDPRRVVELDFGTGPLTVHWSQQALARPIQSTDQAWLEVTHIPVLAGGDERADVLVIPSEDPAQPASLVALDGKGRPLAFWVQTPWGILEWSAISASNSRKLPSELFQAPQGQESQ